MITNGHQTARAFSSWVRCRAHSLYKLDIARKTISPVVTGKAISEFDFDNKGMVYYTYSTTGKPSALYRQQMKKWNGTPVARGKEQQITFLNQKLEDEVDIRPSESIWVDGAGGDKVQVFIVKPHNFDASKKYPLSSMCMAARRCSG